MKAATLLDTPGTSVHDVLEQLEKSGNGAVCLIDESGRLTGIITDGDVRRALLRGETTVAGFVNRNPVTMSYPATPHDVIDKLKTIHCRQMPLVDANNILRDLITVDDRDLPSQPNQVVVMAGGLGRRLGTITETTPKPMVSVGTRPILLHVVNMFTEFGFRDFIFCVNYRKDIIKEFFGDGSAHGVRITYVEELERMGTAGALALAKDILAEDFFVANADIIFDIDLEALLRHHKTAGALGTICTRTIEQEVPYGVINYDSAGCFEQVVEKPKYRLDANAGIYVLAEKALEFLGSPEYLDMTDYLNTLAGHGNISTFAIDGPWFDVGRPADLIQVDETLSLKSSQYRGNR